ncbi:MAG: hypothetical protein R3F35_13930 [Myxococcota bacterium]
MPRDLSDVLHFFLPELESPPEPRDTSTRRFPHAGPAATPSAPSTTESPREALLDRPTTAAAARRPLSILGVPLGERDLVHAALTWNLAVETARQGGAVAIVVPESDRDSALWSAHAPGPHTPEILFCPARHAADLYAAAGERAETLRRSTRRGGIVFVRLPPEWLEASPAAATDAMRWILLFTSPRREDGSATFERVRRLVEQRPGLEIGVTVRGVARIEEARDAFDELARRCHERLGLALASYGLLTDDLDVYRAIAAGRAIGSTHPRSPAARALVDVARLLYEDARSRLLG